MIISKRLTHGGGLIVLDDSVLKEVIFQLSYYFLFQAFPATSPITLTSPSKASNSRTDKMVRIFTKSNLLTIYHINMQILIGYTYWIYLPNNNISGSNLEHL